MTNTNQYGTQITDLSVVISRCSLDYQDGGFDGILWMLAFLISDTEITTKATT